MTTAAERKAQQQAEQATDRRTLFADIARQIEAKHTAHFNTFGTTQQASQEDIARYHELVFGGKPVQATAKKNRIQTVIGRILRGY